MTKHLILTREFPPMDGGIAQLGYEMARDLSQSGKVVVLTWQVLPGKQPMTFSDAKQIFRVVRIPWVSTRWGQIHAFYRQALRLIREESITHVWALNWNFMGVSAFLLKLFHRIPYAVFVYGYEVRKPPLSWSDVILMKLALSQAKCVLAISRFTQGLVHQLMPGLTQITSIPLGVDEKRFKPVPDAESLKRRWGVSGKKVLLTVARLVERKGHDQVILAMAKICKQIQDVVYVIAGTGPDLERLKSMVTETGMQNHVVFTGFIPTQDLSGLYNACDVFVLPNREIHDPKDPFYGDCEGFGMVFLEANACGKPVIAGRSGGAGDAIEDGVTGFLVDPMSPDEIAERTLALLTDDTLYQKISNQARCRVEREMTWDRVISKYEQVFYGRI